jgi:hexulose-6-phosphate isomerase
MSELLLEGTEAERASRAKKLKWLMERSSCAGIRHIVLPFVDNSAIKSALLKDRLVGLMRGFLADLTHFHLEFHLETSLAPAPFAALLEEIGSPLVKVNYDSGNSASLGYDSSEEMEAYGHRIGSIHIKDRVRGGKTVPLGHGAVDFSTLRHEIGKIDYLGNFVLQAARGRTGEEVEWARQNAAFARHHLGI